MNAGKGWELLYVWVSEGRWAHTRMISIKGGSDNEVQPQMLDREVS